jgi:starch synthase
MGHPTLNANSRAAASALADAGLLGEFHTSFKLQEAPVWLPTAIRAEARRRALPPSVVPFARSHPLTESLRLGLQRAGAPHRINHRLVDATYARIDQAMSRRVRSGASGVYAYEDGAVRSFRAAARLDVPRIYDLPIGYWRAAQSIFAEEADLRPEWASTLPGLSDGAHKLSQKDEELELSTLTLVASTFVLSTLDTFPGKLPPISVIPYGASRMEESAVRPPVQRNRQGERLRALFVGGLSQRKGLSYMFDALSMLGDCVELTVVGRPSGESAALENALSRPNVRWVPSLGNADVLAEMQQHDVLIFPSLFEGFGLVLTEALEQGLPVIATPNTAAPDLISDGVEGWIVPIRSADAIADKLSMLYESAELREEMSKAALRRAAELKWEGYESALAERVGSHIRA